MELVSAKQNVNELAWYRDRDLPCVTPIRVRIIATTSARVEVSTQLDFTQAAPKDSCFFVDPDELHFERSAFDPY